MQTLIVQTTSVTCVQPPLQLSQQIRISKPVAILADAKDKPRQF